MTVSVGGMTGHVMLIEDDDALRLVLERALVARGHVVTAFASPEPALEALDGDADPDVVLTDLQMGRMDGLAVCKRVVEQRPDTPVIVATAFGSMETAVEALRAGALDFLNKPLDIDVLALTIERAVEHHRLKREVRRLKRRAREVDSPSNLVGDSEPMRQLARLIQRVAKVPSSVLISGESGTGKELVARALHEQGPRSDRPFVAINCAAMPEALLESELFGHARGAFTGAAGQRQGLFVRASGGTLFLDEIGDMPQGLQPKLLRALQERTVRPVGGDAEVPIDVRVIAATHRDLEAAVDAGTFRGDLLYRLDVIRVDLPPLRARGTDVLLLAQTFIRLQNAVLETAVTGLTPHAARRLMDYDWPGNVRELANCIERAVVLAEGAEIALGDLPAKLQRFEPSTTALAVVDDPAAMAPMAEVEKRYILRVLEAVSGNKATAARILQIDRKTLYRKLERWGK